MQPFVKLTCRWCGNKFTPSRSWQKFCSVQCKQDHHTQRTKLARQQYKKDFEQ